jgi:hypothetical protein
MGRHRREGQIASALNHSRGFGRSAEAAASVAIRSSVTEDAQWLRRSAAISFVFAHEVEDERSAGGGLTALRLACVDDDAQGEVVEVLWDAELDGSVLRDEGWNSVAKLGTDDASVFSAYLRTLRWNTATAADRDLFQAPFRAGIHLDAYQLLPLRKALRLPRVNLLIADDVGAGKTVEARLVLRELLLRRRIDLVLVAAPISMVLQWQDELEAKFGLSFTVIATIWPCSDGIAATAPIHGPLARASSSRTR